MSAPEKNSPDSRDYIQDPDLPLDQASGLTDADRTTAQRQRYLDQQLKSAMAEVHTRVDSRQPDADTFMLRLQNSIEAIDREAGAAARKKAESDAGAYLGKIAWRRRMDWLRERFVFSENHGMRIAAAAGVAVIALVPLLLSQSGASNQVANLNGALESAAPAYDGVELTDGAGASPAADEAGLAAVVAQEESQEFGDRDEAGVTGGPRLATAPGPVPADAPPDIPEELLPAGEYTGEVVASRAAAKMEADDASAQNEKATAGAPPQLDATALQIEILSGRLKQAKTADEKLVILRGLRSLYVKAGQPGKIAEVDRQIKSLQ